MRLHLQYYKADFKSLISYHVTNLNSLYGPERCCIIQGNSEHIHNSGLRDWLWPDFAIFTPEKGGRGWKLHMDILTQHTSFTSE